MSVTITKKFKSIEAHEDKTVRVVYELSIDDPDDDLLPTTTSQVLELKKNTYGVDEDGIPTVTPTDISNHDPLVQTICNAVWADDEEDEAVE